jgi:hypothetical protein
LLPFRVQLSISVSGDLHWIWQTTLVGVGHLLDPRLSTYQVLPPFTKKTVQTHMCTPFLYEHLQEIEHANREVGKASRGGRTSRRALQSLG